MCGCGQIFVNLLLCSPISPRDPPSQEVSAVILNQGKISRSYCRNVAVSLQCANPPMKSLPLSDLCSFNIATETFELKLTDDGAIELDNCLRKRRDASGEPQYVWTNVG